jgi:glycosyltransferase involved in cell wall biosynthesis
MISVCICTYNRSESLRRTLESLAKQDEIDWSAIEVLIVDNNCSDDTSKVVEAFRERLPIRRVTECRQGLSYARNMGAEQFRGDVLLYTDDDVRFGPGWLAAYREAICHFTDAGYFGGRIVPDWGNEKPRWIGGKPLPLIDGAFVWFDLGAETRMFRMEEPTPFGASFAIRRHLFNEIGLFRVDLGPGGTGRGFGDETEFLLRARDAGARGVYVGKALCFHDYDPKRFTLPALYRYGIACANAHNAIADQPRRGHHVAAAAFIIKGVFQLIKGRGDRFRQCIINAGIEIGSRKPIVKQIQQNLPEIF